ncbi:leucine-rich repeat-containing protein 46 isoform X1 [Alexandromys fortis]|uniref:leucine-rich repeat-containing protein 46 isoform X1 n=1 Tax=Alexandromys fortis TaxID=100897 RepID=UPI0021526993|nr:leucine-rich repeat-containing protein 46 isoform X1 [Microtus fortis]XP_050012646.1 leucine-rich repeat-containing protein 46 isoform X1 [Microtus fortis]XP_050012647.1 leucine-rich repeat-containing protein 46 isoform X1 [Microtus fortis]XP_050012648.1 leucine-rich repeat-containing protein 46 isoform X1 [Microtus fortis]XP_050012649.1 leucine-rich repeat-containing protein 46 isoform X1 [Microtus fortis]
MSWNWTDSKKAAQSTEEGEVPITEALITKRNLNFPEDEDLSEKMFHTLDELETVRLDREGITTISNLEGLRNIHSLYLQLNKIQRIENLACITSLRYVAPRQQRSKALGGEKPATPLELSGGSPSLALCQLRRLALLSSPHPVPPLVGQLPTQGSPPSSSSLSSLFPCSFLSLAGNQIRQVENLLDLQYLQFLDLSENLIEVLKLDEFPQSLLILNLCGNPCTTQDGYRKTVIEALPLLLDLDKQPIIERWTSDEEDKSSDEEEEFPELNGPFCTERGFFKDLEQELKQHRERRQQEVLAEHLSRMETQPVLTDLPILPAVPMAGDGSPAVTVQPKKELAPKAASSTETTSSTTKPVPRSHKSSVRARKKAPAATATAKTSLAAAPSKTKTIPRRNTK